MNKVKFFLTIALVLAAIVSTFAQNAVVPAGDNIKGTEGSISFTIGQTAYEPLSGQNLSISPGVQQAYEFFTTAVYDELPVDLDCVTYPNPVADIINIKVPQQNIRKLNYKLIGLNGKEIKHGQIDSEITSIPFGTYPSSTYILVISENSKMIKTFKIIKN